MSLPSNEFRLGIFVLCILFSGTLCSFAIEADDLPAKADFHIFLLAGQSNMAGRGNIEPHHQKIHPRVLVLDQNGNWIPAQHPLHWDKPRLVGVGLGKSFAESLVEADPDVTIGLVPAACGGSPISAWLPGAFFEPTKSHPYDDAINRAHQALKDGTLKGILWHQGEADSKADRAAHYQQKLEELIRRFRDDLGAPDVPFLIGQLGRFPPNPWDEYKELVDQAQQAIASADPRSAFIPSTDLTARDRNHFDADSYVEFGRRYAKAYLALSRDLPLRVQPLEP